MEVPRNKTECYVKEFMPIAMNKYLYDVIVPELEGQRKKIIQSKGNFFTPPSRILRVEYSLGLLYFLQEAAFEDPIVRCTMIELRVLYSSVSVPLEYRVRLKEILEILTSCLARFHELPDRVGEYEFKKILEIYNNKVKIIKQFKKEMGKNRYNLNDIEKVLQCLPLDEHYKKYLESDIESSPSCLANVYTAQEYKVSPHTSRDIIMNKRRFDKIRSKRKRSNPTNNSPRT